ALFDLTQNQDFIFESLNNEDYTVTYYEDLSSAIDGTDQITTPAAYNSNTQEQTIYVRIQSDDDPDCFETASFTIESFPAGVAHNAQDISFCLTDSDDMSVDLTQNTSLILGDQAAADFKITYYESADDANGENNAIVNPEDYQFPGDPNDCLTIYARIKN